LKFLA